MARPEHFVPVHGEYRHMVAHARLATKMGVAESNVIVAEDGDQLILDENGLRLGGRIPAEYIFVHGTVGDVGVSTIGERRVLGSEGMVSAIVCVDRERREIVAGPEIISRGWVSRDGTSKRVDAVKTAVRTAVERAMNDPKDDLRNLDKVVRRAAGSMVSEQTRRRPMIVPVVIDA